MYDVVQTKEFERWHRGLRDSRAVARVTTAVERLQLGLVGDYKSVGGGVSEIRMNLTEDAEFALALGLRTGPPLLMRNVSRLMRQRSSE